MCKDLWDLRIRNFVGLTPAPVVGGGGKKKMAGAAGGVDKKKPGSSSSQKSQQSGSDTEMVMYSSQGENSSADERVRSSNTATSAVGNSKKSGRVRNWATENWALPGAIDTLALLYLGCLLRQDPVRIGDIYRWAKAGELPYLSAVSSFLSIICLTDAVPYLINNVTNPIASLSVTSPPRNCWNDYQPGVTNLS